MTLNQDARITQMLDRVEIQELVRRERFARDQQHWEVMRDCFHPDAHIRTSWYDGNATDYIPATRKLMAMSPYGKHWVLSGFTTVMKDRATVESPAMIYNRIALNDVEVDFHVYCRFHSRVERWQDQWRLLSFEVIFERDTLKPVDPAQALPFDPKELDAYRPSYRFLSHIQESRGFSVNPDLPGDDRPQQLKTFHGTHTLWLNAGTP